MTQKQKIQSIETTVLVLLWALLFVTPLLFEDDLSRNWRAVHVLWVEYVIMLFAFLINRLCLMPRLFYQKKYSKYIISLCGLMSVIVVFLFCFDGVNEVLSLMGDGQGPEAIDSMRGSMPPPRGGAGHFPPGASHAVQSQFHRYTLTPPSFDVLVMVVLALAIDMGLSIAIKWIIAEQNQAELKRENVAAQLRKLQSQVSPHFFMNTLNNIHALIEIDPQKAQQTIIELSGLMDYLLYESSNIEKVSLSREIEFIASYINLMRLRYPKRVEIDFSHTERIPQVKIPPLLFLNFIENTFKYGVDYSKDSFIMIRFNLTDDKVELITTNTNHSATVKSTRRGLGISNSRKRLKLLYDNRFTLDICEQTDIFYVNLKIPTQ